MKPGFFCAATRDELQTLGLEGAEIVEPNRLWKIPEGYAAVTGVGIPATLLRLPRWIDALQPRWIVNTGLAGAYAAAEWEVGDLAVGSSEIFADLGMEMPDAEGFRPLSRFAFADPSECGPLALWVPEEITGALANLRLRRGRGATVNGCTGRASTGALRHRLFAADFESMEGAAVALVAERRGIPVCEVRAISNIAADRDLRPENVAAALRILAEFWRQCRRELP